MEQDREEERAFVARFLKLADAVDGRLLRAALVLAAMLLAAQALLAIGAARERLTGVDRLEGQSYSFAHSPERMLY